jgi:hypothetical protein
VLISFFEHGLQAIWQPVAIPRCRFHYFGSLTLMYRT